MFWFNDPATEVMKSIMNLHNTIMYYLIGIVLFVGWFLLSIIDHYGLKKEISYSSDWETFLTGRKEISEESFQILTLETGWTLGPGIILASIASISFSLMYVTEYIVEPLACIKIVGHQWYWSYEHQPVALPDKFVYKNINDRTTFKTLENLDRPIFQYGIIGYGRRWDFVYFNFAGARRRCIWPLLYRPTYGFTVYAVVKQADVMPPVPGKVTYDSYLVPTESLKLGQKRLLTVDNVTRMQINEPVKCLITSADVLHSWAVPALGIKMDAVPGRMNSVHIVPNRPGLFYGQCSEICGVNHGFMPISVGVLDWRGLNGPRNSASNLVEYYKGLIEKGIIKRN